MAAVPYNPVPEVPISQQGIQGVNVPTPIAAFGGTIADAIGTAGRSLERAGDEIMQRAIALKQLENETEAREADANYTMELGELRAKYHSEEGKNAVAAFPQYVRNVRTLQEKYAGSMSNPMSRRIFDRESRGMMSRTIFAGAGHSAQQNRRWAEGSAVAEADNAINDGLHNRSPSASQDTRRKIRETSETVADLNGWDESQRVAWERNKTSQFVLTQLQGIARDDPFEAQKFLDANRGELRTEHIEKAEQVVKTNLYRVGSLRIANEVNDQPIEGGENLETRIEKGVKQAKELVPDDAEFHGYVRDQIITKYNKMSGVRKEAVQERRNVIESALIGGLGNGQIPTSPGELMSLSPEAKAAWESLQPADQRRYMGIMAKLSKGDVSYTPERLREMERLKGMASQDTAAFMALDIAGLDLPISARKQLLDLRVALAKRSGGDPRLSSALQMLRPMLNSAGITPDEANRDRYWQFVGGLTDAIQDWQKANPGKVPKKEDYEKIGAALIGNQRDPTKWTFGIFPNRQTPLFEQTLPDQLLEDFRADPRWRGQEPTQADLEMFRRQYIRQRYKELFGGSASGAKKTGQNLGPKGYATIGPMTSGSEE